MEKGKIEFEVRPTKTYKFYENITLVPIELWLWRILVPVTFVISIYNLIK
jgi:hypothetical protein